MSCDVIECICRVMSLRHMSCDVIECICRVMSLSAYVV